MTSLADHSVLSSEDSQPNPYEYKECGLQGIFLYNGYEIARHAGEEFVSVVDTEGLHRAICLEIVQNSKELAPDEIRFLRKTMHLTQSELGHAMGQSSQQIARWEKAKSGITGPADRLLRAIFLLENMDPDERESFKNLLEEIDGMDDLTPRRIQLVLNGDEWERNFQQQAAV